MIKILIADDHSLIREGFKKIIGGETDMKVIGECQNAAEVLDFLRANEECDLLVLDLNMPGKSGLDLLKELPFREIKLKVLVLSIHPESRFAVRALQAGASGYITKDMAVEELVEAVRKIYYGGKYVSRALAEQLADYLTRDADRPLHESLSDREFQVLQFLAQGKATAEIMETLSLSASSVKTYRQRLQQKLHVKTSAEIIHYAFEHKLLD